MLCYRRDVKGQLSNITAIIPRISFFLPKKKEPVYSLLGRVKHG